MSSAHVVAPAPAAGSTASGLPRQASATPARSALPSAYAGQRGWNRQPAGIRVGSGISPRSTTGSIRATSGTTDSSAWV